MTKRILLSALLIVAMAAPALADTITDSLPGVQGYDLVSYQNGKRPVRGNGHFVSEVDGVAYLFSSEENKQAFDKDPQRYLPAFGGYCAYGVSVGKKFVGDPEVWRVVDGRLYLNLDANIQDLWLKDVPGNLKKADQEWKKIAAKAPQAL